MGKTGHTVAKVVTGAAALAVGCLAVVYAAEILTFLGSNARWIVGGLAIWTAVSILLGLAIGAVLRKPDVHQHGYEPTEPVRPAAAVEIPAPTSPHDSEHGVPLNAPARSRLTSR